MKRSLNLWISKGEKKTKSSIEEPPKLELKPLSNHLNAYLGENDTLLVIIFAHMNTTKEKTLLNMLKLHKQAIGRTPVVIQGISPSYYMHKIKLEEDQTGTIKLKM